MIANNEAIVIDVRAQEDYCEGHLPDAISIPYEMLKNKISELSRNETYVVYCYNQQCHLGAHAAFFLVRNGFSVIELDGGFDVWKNDFGFNVVK